MNSSALFLKNEVLNYEILSLQYYRCEVLLQAFHSSSMEGLVFAFVVVLLVFLFNSLLFTSTLK